MEIKVEIKEAGACYYFSHETIKKYENGEIIFFDKDGAELKPSYFGAGMNGMNGRLIGVRQSIKRVGDAKNT